MLAPGCKYHHERDYPPNESFGDLLGLAQQPFAGGTSAPREYMVATHKPQSLPTDQNEVCWVQTGYDRKIGEAAFCTEFPEDCQIVAVIPRYPRTMEDAIRENPETIVIFQTKQGQYGHLSVKAYTANHPYFGFRNKINPILDTLQPGQPIDAGVKLASSPNVTPEGDYMEGFYAWIAAMTYPCVSDDGIGIRREYLESKTFRMFHRRSGSWGTDRYPKNLFGDAENYKAFPDIGDVVTPGRPIMAFGGYDDVLMAPLFTAEDCAMLLDLPGDVPIYGAPFVYGRVIDVIVIHDQKRSGRVQPIQDAQALKYDRARRRFYENILGVYRKIHAEHGDRLKLLPEFHTLLRDAEAFVGDGANSVELTERVAPLDVFHIEFVIEYVVCPGMGAKFTDFDGSKAVVVKILENHQMPYDPVTGRLADIVIDPDSTVNRQNVQREVKRRINIAILDVQAIIADIMGYGKLIPETKSRDLLVEYYRKVPQEQLYEAWGKLMLFYDIVTPHVVLDIFEHNDDYETVLSMLAHVTIHKPKLLSMPENKAHVPVIIEELNKHFPTHKGPVQFYDVLGNFHVTKQPVPIWPQYMMLLDKIGDDAAATSSARMERYGIPAPMSRAIRNLTPLREQPPRIFGEAEIRILRAYAPAWLTAEVLHRNNDPKTHELMCEGILRAEDPMNIEDLTPRPKVPWGQTAPLKIIDAFLYSTGVGTHYEPDDDYWTDEKIREYLAKASFDDDGNIVDIEDRIIADGIAEEEADAEADEQEVDNEADLPV